jgi:hypothetical protein
MSHTVTGLLFFNNLLKLGLLTTDDTDTTDEKAPGNPQSF